MWCNVGFANDMGKIEDIKINGISIGDNLLDHFSKQTLIQNKELLSARTQSNKLFYMSKVGDWVFHYESNERVGMTEKTNYRIIGIYGLTKCDVRKKFFDKDKIFDVMTSCIKNDETKEHIDKLISYPFSKIESDNIIVKEDGSLSYDINYTSSGCHNDNVSINFFSKLKFSDSYNKPEITFVLISRELDQILLNKYC